jgi:ATP-binding cassette, subfamily G (WHITE), member 2, SNQ2
MSRSPADAGFQFAVILLTETFAVTLAQAIQALSPSFYIASLLNPWILTLFTIMSGVMIPKPSMTHFWKSWMYQLDPFTYIISSMSTTALHGIEVQCGPDELNSFPIPSGTTCGSYTADFLSAAPGYIVNASATDMCDYCAYSVGDNFLDALDISYHDRGRNLGILAMFTITNLIVVYLAVSLKSRILHIATRSDQLTTQRYDFSTSRKDKPIKPWKASIRKLMLHRRYSKNEFCGIANHCQPKHVKQQKHKR